MIHLKEYEDHETEGLFKDLTSLGLNDGRVVIKIRKKIPTRRELGLLDFADIIFPTLDEMTTKITTADIVEAISQEDYEIIPKKYGSEYGNGPQHTVAKRIDHKMMVCSRRLSLHPALVEASLYKFIKDFAVSFQVTTEVDLVIDGGVKASEANNR